MTASLVLVPSLSVLLFNNGYIDFRIMVQMVQIASTTTQRGYMTKPSSDQMNSVACPCCHVSCHNDAGWPQ